MPEEQEEVSQQGIFAAVFIAAIGTAGHILTADRPSAAFYDTIWLAVFFLALLTLSGAAVNFDFRRLIK